MSTDEFQRRRKELMKLIARAALPFFLPRSRSSATTMCFITTDRTATSSISPALMNRKRLSCWCRARASEYVLFVRERDAAREIWDGRRAGPEGAVKQHGADDAFPSTTSTISCRD